MVDLQWQWEGHCDLMAASTQTRQEEGSQTTIGRMPNCISQFVFFFFCSIAILVVSDQIQTEPAKI